MLYKALASLLALGTIAAVAAQPQADAAAKDVTVLGFRLHYLERTIGGSKKVIIDDCGHMPQIEKADEFNRLVRDCLGGGSRTTQ